MDDPELQPQTDLQTQEILLASSNHNIPQLRTLLRNTNANVQDPETGYTPLHAAIAALEPDDDDISHPGTGAMNGASVSANGSHIHHDGDRDQELGAAAVTVRFLFQHGAVWNEVDTEGETPGCLARRLGLKEIYEIIVDQGVRSELHVTRQDEYQVLLEDDDNSQDATQAVSAADEMNDTVTAAAESFVANASPSNWMSNPDLMETVYSRTAALLLPTEGLSVLSILPTVPLLEALQKHRPSAHYIITTSGSFVHPPDAQEMTWRQLSPSTTISVAEGAWMECLQARAGGGSTSSSASSSQREESRTFDAVFFGGDDKQYKELRSFFQQWASQLLDPEGGSDGNGGLLSFWHGWGSERQVEYDVYTKIMEMDLFEADFDVEWTEIAIANSRGREANTYKLPICRIVD